VVFRHRSAGFVIAAPRAYNHWIIVRLTTNAVVEIRYQRIDDSGGARNPFGARAGPRTLKEKVMILR